VTTAYGQPTPLLADETPSPLPGKAGGGVYLCGMGASRPGWRFSTKVSAAMALLAMLALLQGGVNWWISGIAAQRVERGRIAADLHAGFIELSAVKQQLKAWALQVMLGAVPPPADGDRLSRRLVERTDELRALSLRTREFDLASAAPTVSEHELRDRTLELLRDSFLRLREAVLGLDALSPVGEPQTAWRSLERLFDVAGDVDLGALVQTALTRETQWLAQKRAAADLSLKRLQALSVLATATIALLALALAALLARGLRRPLADMEAAASALRRGDLEHRVPVRGEDELSGLAASVNAMAQELAAHRRAEAMTRERLQERVAEQTRDLQDAVEALQLSETRRRRLIADISHELRTPTTAIRGEAEIALRGGVRDPEIYRQSLTSIVEASAQLGDVIEDLLTLARSDADALTIRHGLLDLGDIVDLAVAQARSTAAQRGVTIEVAGPVRPVPVKGDAQRLRQVVGLLLDNAIRYSHPGGSVTVALEAGGTDETVLTVSDRGIGIEPDEVDVIFERQHRSARARIHRPDGAGLGLAIARDLIERHGGSITARPLAIGACFEVRLPSAGAGLEAA
jgi:signal transduction histidine kinase